MDLATSTLKRLGVLNATKITKTFGALIGTLSVALALAGTPRLARESVAAGPPSEPDPLDPSELAPAGESRGRTS